LTPVRATAQNRSDEEKPPHSPARPDDRGKVTGLICHALLTARTPMGAGNGLPQTASDEVAVHSMQTTDLR